ncbi:Lrp/AsnC family transcriptional regulator [Thermoplasma sp.]|uniref:Lrp/AsnC family transcriptional regulator n=1 Tax=Thermoplasma sp. TaxID=1973142 RepID=UPI001288CA2F|nr:Lrp/AsnC family transcriptional regulator [Thermoplasma sp.]KAA8923500.1 MAG: Lrp/AsnC family transcriptional regulator [Thermoplasma sp.]
MDEKDIQILNYLMDNARDKISDMSRVLDIPRVTIYERMQNMIKSGIIKKFTIVPDYKALGVPVVAFILVAYTPKDGLSQRELAAKIANFKDVENVYIIAGEWDILIKVRESSTEAVGNFVLDKLREMPGVERAQTITVFSEVK